MHTFLHLASVTSFYSKTVLLIASLALNFCCSKSDVHGYLNFGFMTVRNLLYLIL